MRFRAQVAVAMDARVRSLDDHVLRIAVRSSLPYLAGPPKPSRSPTLDVVYAKVGDRELKLDLARPPKARGRSRAVVCRARRRLADGEQEGRPRSGSRLLAERGLRRRQRRLSARPGRPLPGPDRGLQDGGPVPPRERRQVRRSTRIASRAMGYSAGGHLACLLGLTDETAGFEGKEYPKESSRVQAVVDYFGPTDLAAFGKDDSAQRSMLGPFIGAKFADNPAAHEKASPIKYVTKGAPPFLIFHGTKDWIVPIEQSRALAEQVEGRRRCR